MPWKACKVSSDQTSKLLEHSDYASLLFRKKGLKQRVSVWRKSSKSAINESDVGIGLEDTHSLHYYCSEGQQPPVAYRSTYGTIIERSSFRSLYDPDSNGFWVLVFELSHSMLSVYQWSMRQRNNGLPGKNDPAPRTMTVIQ
ncbi:hypothetical protein BDF20DRAFT_833532 [Mycotypha africana]|uniref:uncharacterized protein n=1 Tax=Mycotypha africana TaxID=64632 RepID=UPI002301772B|nr:uncharacterized protein BDF20DRAFT_833532 [Mycotypha africana]KAI8983985.1 hypothetical protein BDF20DRAFT_833532 [Mycotypha africana]